MSAQDHPEISARPAPAVANSMALRVAAELPWLRRYARALTGAQDSGDRYAAATIEALLAERSLLEAGYDPRITLFRTFHSVWQTSGMPVAEPAELSGPERRAQALLAGLTPDTREALLLFAIEEFSHEDIGTIMRIPPGEAAELIAIAYRETQSGIPGRILIIEDESLIALDLAGIVEDMGHRVVGTAATRDEAVRLGRATRPDLILADVQLADRSSGIDAVRMLQEDLPGVPAIFITALPERLLTGEKPEPAFLITKPFSEDRVRSAVSQAMFFASTAPLAG